MNFESVWWTKAFVAALVAASRPFLALGTLLAAGLLAPAPAAAQSSGNACIVQEVGGNPPCTANDVRVGSVTLIAGPTTCDPSDLTPFSVTLEATIESGPDRYDIGLWVNESGGSAKDDPTGTCYRDYLPPPLSATACDQDGGPYFDNDGDTCGDVFASGTDPCGTAVTGPCTDGSGGTCLFTTRQFTMDIVCTDSNGNGTADAGTCTSWDNNDNSACTTHLETNPGTGSKCSCEPVEILGLFTGCQVDEDCDDGIACTDDTCAVVGNVGTCSNTPNNDSCSGDQCNEGICDPANEGADADGCFAEPVADSTPCEDGSFCTSETGAPATPDHCESGTCVGIPVDCGPGDQCNDDVCNEETDACEVVPKADSTPCEDGSICTSETGTPQTPDHCEVGQCVGVPVDCSGEDDQCNDGVCNVGTGACEPIPKADSTPCEDGSICTSETGTPQTPDHCEVGVCTGVPVDCDDGNFCTTDSCNLQSGACESENVCSCELTKTCQVIPDPGPFVCSDAKPIDCLTMIWNGLASVGSFTAYDGDVGGTELTDVTISGGDNFIDPGDAVTVCGMGGSPNDQEWLVDGQVSQFHISCSDSDMNGPEDCGNPAGDGKSDDPSLLNDWLFEGMTGSGGTLDCNPTPPAPSDSCEFVDQPVDCDSVGDPDFLTWMYTGGGCAASDNQQGPGKHVCTETGGVIDGVSSIDISDKDGNTATLNPGDEVTFTRSASGELTLNQPGVEEFNEIHVSCSQPLVAGDVFGSLTLVALDGQRAGREVIYGYTVTYTNPLGPFPVTDIEVTDVPLGTIGTVALASGESATLTETVRIEDTITNMAFANSQTNPDACSAGPVFATVTATEGCDICKGGTTDLIFEYLGTDDAIPNEQAFVVIYDDNQANNDKILFEGFVNEGELIQIMPRPGQSKLNNEISIYVGGNLNAEVHTSCSQPIGPGLIVGDFEIVEGRSVDNDLMCPLNTCDVDSAVDLEFNGDEVRWTLTNNGDTDIVIDRITIQWPSENGVLTELKRDGDVIHQGDFQPSSAVIDSGWNGDAGKRTIKAGDTDILRFKFVNDAAAVTDDYVITVEFEGCPDTTFLPEPNGIVSLVSGIALLGWLRRRRRL